jgi:hypothetical protein
MGFAAVLISFLLGSCAAEYISMFASEWKAKKECRDNGVISIIDKREAVPILTKIREAYDASSGEYSAAAELLKASQLSSEYKLEVDKNGETPFWPFNSMHRHREVLTKNNKPVLQIMGISYNTGGGFISKAVWQDTAVNSACPGFQYNKPIDAIPRLFWHAINLNNIIEHR